MFPKEWRPILKSMALAYPQGSNLRLIGRSTGLEAHLLKRTVRDLTTKGFVLFDATDRDGRMLSLTEAGMAVACDRASRGDAPEVVDALQVGALRALTRSREQRSSAAHMG